MNDEEKSCVAGGREGRLGGKGKRCAAGREGMFRAGNCGAGCCAPMRGRVGREACRGRTMMAGRRGVLLLDAGVARAMSARGVPAPLEGVGALGVGAVAGATGTAGLGWAAGLGGYRLAISSWTAFSVRSPRPSKTTLIFSVPDKPIRCPSHTFVTCTATSCAVPFRPDDGPSNLTQHIPSCIPDLESIFELISRGRP